MILTNALSLNMLPPGAARAAMRIRRISVEEASCLLKKEECESYIGHHDLCAILSGSLGTEVRVNRGNFVAKSGDTIVVAQYVGPRLQEGATMLPSGARIEFFLVEFSSIQEIE